MPTWTPSSTSLAMDKSGSPSRCKRSRLRARGQRSQVSCSMTKCFGTSRTLGLLQFPHPTCLLVKRTCMPRVWLWAALEKEVGQGFCVAHGGCVGKWLKSGMSPFTASSLGRRSGIPCLATEAVALRRRHHLRRQCRPPDVDSRRLQHAGQVCQIGGLVHAVVAWGRIFRRLLLRRV